MAWRSNGELSEVCSGVLAKVISGIRAVSFHFFRFAKNYCETHHEENSLNTVYPDNSKQLLNFHVTSDLNKNSFSRVFPKNFRENTAFWKKCSILGSYFFTQTRICHLLQPRYYETAFAKQQLAFTDFWDDKIIFFS